MDRDPFDLIGDVLDGQFRVDAFAGEGDLSVVYKGHHLGVDAPVAIKCLNLPETLDRALARPLVDGFNEASRVHYRLARGNLHIAQTIASGSTLVPRSGIVVPYLVREWFEGESLASDLGRRRAEKQGGRSIDEALELLETAFDGIAYAHAQGEVHLSINPSNLFVVDGEGPQTTMPSLKVLDFGVASTMNAFASGIPAGARGARASGGLRLLFPAYAAPEQLDRTVGDLGPWTDVYAIALVMMEVLSDRIVMGETETGAIVEHALDEQRRPTPQAHGLRLPSHIERALARAVARSPARRQKSAAELWKDVRNTVRTLAPRAMAAAAATSTRPAPGIVTPAPGRARAPTLVGLSPPVVLPVPGASDRSRVAGPTSVVTKPMAFEPTGGPLPAAIPQVLRTPTPIPLIATPNGAAIAAPPVRLPALPSARPPPVPSAAPPSLSATPPPPPFATPPPPPFATPPPPFAPAPPPLSAAASGPPVSASPPPSTAAPVSASPSPSAAAPPPRPPPPPASASYAPPPTPDSAPEAGPVLMDAVNYARKPRRFTNPLAFPFTPRGAPIVLSVAGGLFWMWAFGVFLWVFALRPRHPRSAPVAPPSIVSTAPVESADAPVQESPHPAVPDSTAVAQVSSTAPFRNAAAIRSLDGKWREVAKCRRGKAWGKASTTVTFAGDGSVTHVDIGPPFAGTPTGDCIAGTLAATRVEPFGDSEAVLVYRVYVAPK